MELTGMKPYYKTQVFPPVLEAKIGHIIAGEIDHTAPHLRSVT